MVRAPQSACLSPELSFRKASLPAETVLDPLPLGLWNLTVRPHYGGTATHLPTHLEAAQGSLQTNTNGSWQNFACEGWRHGENLEGSVYTHDAFLVIGICFTLGASLEKVSTILQTKLNLLGYDVFTSKTCLKVNIQERI